MRPRRPDQTNGPRPRSIERKTLKSPLRIRQKIKQLDLKLEKEAFLKQMLNRKNSKDKNKRLKIARKQVSPQRLSPNRALILQKRPISTSQDQRHLFRKRNFSFSRDKPKATTQQILQALYRVSNQETAKQEDEDTQAINLLKAQNEKYKKKYDMSVYRMRELQGRLKEIKDDHENQTGKLQQAINDLNRQINSKKIILGHLYNYEGHKKNLLALNDAIITESENQYENSNISGMKPKQTLRLPSYEDLSRLSLQSHQR